MTFLEDLQKVEQLVFGHWSPLVGIILVTLTITFLWDCALKKPPVIAALKIVGQKFAIYLTFFVIAHQLDLLFANKLLEFEGATQFFVAIYVLAREVNYILKIFRDKGIEVPWILTTRAKALEDIMKGIAPPAEQQIDSKIKELKESIEKLKELQNAGKELIGEAGVSPEDSNQGKKEQP